MSGYEVEHNIKEETTPSVPPRRPDLSSFFSALSQLDGDDEAHAGPNHHHHNPHATPHPSDVAATYRLLANAFQILRHDQLPGTTTTTTAAGGGAPPTSSDSSYSSHHDPTESHTALLTTLIDSLMASADTPPTTIPGAPQSFLDALDRVPKSALGSSDTCPICGNPFLDDPYPLVVSLPCDDRHRFDLECVGPWLRLNPTCPLDRRVLWKAPEERRKAAAEEERRRKKEGEESEEEWDEMFA